MTFPSVSGEAGKDGYTDSSINVTVLHDAYQRLFGTDASRRRCIGGLTPLDPSTGVMARAATMRLTQVGAAKSDGRKKIMSAYDDIAEGSILVVQVVGDPGGGVIGDLLAHRLARIGVPGAIVDGPVRDVNGILDHGLKVWAKTFAIGGMMAGELRVELNIDVSIAGVAVSPGDLLSADRDGIFVVPEQRVYDVLEVSRALLAEEAEAHRKLATGLPILAAYPNIRAE